MADLFEGVVASFYVLERTIMELEDAERKHKDPRFSETLNEARKFRKVFHTRLARCMRDSMLGMAFGEARHTRSVASTSILVETKDGSYELIRSEKCIQSRDNVYRRLEKYSESDVIRLRDLFYDSGWGGTFGGRAWGELCDRIMQYEILPPSAYCDLVFHVVHNGGCAFSKGFLLCYSEKWKVKALLDLKREYDIVTAIDDYATNTFCLCKTVNRIYEKTRYLIFLFENRIFGSSKWYEIDDFELKIVKWNRKPNLIIVENDHDYGDRDDDDDYYDEEDDYYGEEEMEEMVTKEPTSHVHHKYKVEEVPRREYIDF